MITTLITVIFLCGSKGYVAVIFRKRKMSQFRRLAGDFVNVLLRKMRCCCWAY